MWTFIKSLLGLGGCRHEWQSFIQVHENGVNSMYEGRKCLICGRTEKFTPDCGGWTSGHWDEVK